MRRIYVIARREYLAMVATKGFVIGLLAVPILMLGGIFIPQLFMNRIDLTEKSVIVLDGEGRVFEQLRAAAERRNEHELNDPETGKQNAPAYRLVHDNAAPVTDERRLELSEQVRGGKLAAFLEVPPGLLGTRVEAQPLEVQLYAENASFSDLTRWLEQNVNAVVRSHRLQQAGIDGAEVDRALVPVPLAVMELYERSANGEILKGGRTDRAFEFIFPMTVMMLMFMVMWMSAQSVLECVLEEKRQRIGEVLLGSATPSELMAGKLVGNVLGSMTMLVTYMSVGLAMAAYYDYLDRISLSLLPWFFVFQVLAVVMMSSLFLAVAASVTELKEAGGLLMPVWFIFLIPMWTWFNIVREPNGPLAVGMSFFPPATPMVMVLRMAASESVPLWHPALGAVLVLITSALCVWAAGRIFRIGMLSQGKAPRYHELVKWVFAR